MKIKLVGIKYKHEEVTNGTCDLCYNTTKYKLPTYTFDIDGEPYIANLYQEDYIRYETFYRVAQISDAIEFANWLNHHEFRDVDKSELWLFLFNLVSDYYLVNDYSHDEKLLEKYLL
jgi:hypothetical protein